MIRKVTIDYNKVVDVRVMWHKRTDVHLRFLKALLKALQWRFNEWLNWKSVRTREAYVFAQKKAMQDFLNGAIPNGNDSIIIIDRVREQVWYNYADFVDEVYTDYLDTDTGVPTPFDEDSGATFSTSFAVQIPDNLTAAEEQQVIDIVNKHRLAGLDFTIIRV